MKTPSSLYCLHIFRIIITGFLLWSGLGHASDNIFNNQVVIIKPDRLPALEGKAITELSLVSLKQGSFKPIPYQIDEINEDGSVHIEGVDSLALKVEGADSELSGKPQVFDSNDEMLFMLRDAGEKKTDKDPYAGGKMIAEIEVISIDNRRRYVYVVQGALLKSEQAYVRYSASLGRVETDKYSLKVNDKNAIIWDEFQFFSFQGKHPQQPIDTLKVGVRANVIPLGFVPVYLHNGHLKATPLAEKTGPIRAITTYRQTLSYLRVPLFAGKLQIFHYESKVQYNFVIRIPEGRRQLVANLKFRLSTDGRELDNADIVFSSKADFIGKVDGLVSDAEKSVVDITPELHQKNWIWLDSHERFAMLTTFDINQQTQVDSDFNKPKLEFRFKDNQEEKDKPEFYKGQSPDAGFVVKMPQFGKIFINYSINMFDQDIEMPAAEIANIVDAPFTINQRTF